MAIPNGRITSVTFQVSGTEDVLEESSAPITRYDLFKQGKPFPGGVYDDHLGTTSHEYNCTTCFNAKEKCMGHDGHLMLNQPVISPLFIDEVKKWLRLICFNCGNPVIDIKRYEILPPIERLKAAAKPATTNNKTCIVCKTVHPKVTGDVDFPLMIISKTDDTVVKLYPYMIEEYLNRISDETVIALGIDPRSHPRKFILRAIKIPPTNIRPDVKKLGSGRTSNNELTTIIQNIIRRNDKIPQILPDVIGDDLNDALYGLQDMYHVFIRGPKGKRVITAGGNTPLESLAQRLRGKQGRFRKNGLGKRIRVCARTTISGDPTLRPEQLGVPIKFAKLLQVEEIVQESNRKRLMTIFLNGTKKYPGCSKIIRKRTGSEHNVVDPHSIPELEIGDIILRDLQDGDEVLFNRQPSFIPSSISGMIAVITHDPSILTFRMNVVVCSLFNADFDGDQMNMYVGRDLASRIEIRRHASIPNFFIKHAFGAPLIGQADDSIVGSYLLTRHQVKFDKYHAMLLFNSTIRLPTFDKQSYSTRDIIGMHLADTPINYSGVPKYFDKKLAKYIDYHPEDTSVVIERGVHVKGILDKKSIGKGVIGGIYHLIANKYGEKKAIDMIFDMQQIAIAYLQQHGYSIGIRDIMISKESLKEIHKIESIIIDKSLRLTDMLDAGKIVPPIGKTTKEFYEEQQIAILRLMDDFAEPIFKSINPVENNLMQLILSGSKGSVNHIYHISSAIGQIVINDKRPKESFAYGRTGPHFTRFDPNPEAHGFIPDSYISGMNSDGCAFNAMNARADFVTKALYTAVTGESERNSIKSLESLITTNLLMCTKYNNIVQFIYGENGIDSRRVIKVKIPTIMCSDNEIAAGWKYSTDDKQLQKIFDTEYKRVVDDRNEYRKIFLKIESGKFNEPFDDSKAVAMNIEKIVSDAIYSYGEQKPTPAMIAEMVTTVDEFCTAIMYVMINEIQEKAKTPVPRHIRDANWLLILYIRTILNSVRSLSKLNPIMLQEILDRIRLRQARALCSYGTAVGIIAAMSFSEPLTQYMLDAHHRTTTGGTSKSAMITVNEVLGARETAKLSAPSMIIVAKPDFDTEAQLHQIANQIEVMRLSNFVRIGQIFYEKYGEPTHPTYANEREDVIGTFERLNPLVVPPGDLLKWCIRFVLDRSNMIYKNMPLETIIVRLRDIFPDLHFVYTGGNSARIIIRVYIRNTYFQEHVEQLKIEALRDLLLDTVIRGVPKIKLAVVEKLARHEITADGSMQRTSGKFCIKTIGTNLADMFKIKSIDPYQLQTDAIEEIQNVLGIEAARQRLFTSIRNLGAGGLNAHHVSIYVDEMTYTGAVTSIRRKGVDVREESNVLLRMGFSAPIQTLVSAATNCLVDPIQGVTSPLLVGDIPRTIGTAYNSFHINEEMVKENTVRPDDWLDEL